MKKIKSTENFHKKYIEPSFPAAIYDDTTPPEFILYFTANTMTERNTLQ